jgi:hypothetical protein
MSGLEILALLWIMLSQSNASAHDSPTPSPSGGGGTTKPTVTPTTHATTVKLPKGEPQSVKPWPVANKPDLPAYPDGWEPYTPPPPAVVSRATALISDLWKSGKPGATKVEQTGNVWVTYVSFTPAKGKKGVAAYRLKESGTVSPGTAIVPASYSPAPSKSKSKKKGVKA